MPGPRSATCVFCDDIRFELGNKLSFIGAYSNDILISAPPPITFPKLCIIVWVIHEIDDRPTRLSLSLLTPPERSEILKTEAELGEPQYPYERDELSKGLVRIIVTINNLPIPEEGFMEAMIETEREVFRAGRLRILFNVPAAEMGWPTSG